MKKALVTASIVILVALAAAAQKKPRVAESFIADWNSHEVEKVIPLFTNDVFYEDVTFGRSTMDLRICVNSLRLSSKPFPM